MSTRHVSLLAIFGMGLVLCASGQNPAPKTFRAYELYSWQELNGGWSFCVVPSPSGVNVTAEQVFDKRCRFRGVLKLKRKLARLPAETTIFWLNHIVGTRQGTEKETRLRYPQSAMLQDIRHYAETHKIKMEMLSGESGQR